MRLRIVLAIVLAIVVWLVIYWPLIRTYAGVHA